MKKVEVTIILYLLISICSALIAQNVKDNLNKPFKTEDKFTIFLPSDWREIPNEILLLASRVAEQKYNISTFSEYNYGFQLGSAIDWFDYPYILIQIKKGRIPENEFINTKNIKKDWRKAVDEIEEKLHSILSTIKTNEPIYDPYSKILWVQNEVQFENVGMVKEITGVILTEIGLIEIHCYSSAGEYNNYLPLFEKIINSIELSSDIIYVKKFSDDYPIIQNINWSKIIAAAIIGMLLTLFYSYRKKQKSNFLE